MVCSDMSMLLKLYLKTLINRRIYLAVLVLFIGAVIYTYLVRGGEYNWAQYIVSLDPKMLYAFSIPLIFLVLINAHAFNSSLGIHKLLKLEYVAHVKQLKWDFLLGLLQLLPFLPIVIAGTIFLSIDVTTSIKILIFLTLASLALFLKTITAFLIMLTLQAVLALLLWYSGLWLDPTPLVVAFVIVTILRIGASIWGNTRKVTTIFIGDNNYATIANPFILILLATGVLTLGVVISSVIPPGVKVYVMVLGVSVGVAGNVPQLSPADLVIATIAGSMLHLLLFVIASIAISGMRYYDAPIWYAHYLRFKWGGFIVNILVNYLYAVGVTAILCLTLKFIDLSGFKGLFLVPLVACLVSFLVVPRWKYEKSIESYILLEIVVFGMLLYITPLSTWLLKEYSFEVELIASLIFIVATSILAKIRYTKGIDDLWAKIQKLPR